jgi:hypothetical protein
MNSPDIVGSLLLGFLRKQLEAGTGGREIILTPLRAIKVELISCHCVS